MPIVLDASLLGEALALVIETVCAEPLGRVVTVDELRAPLTGLPFQVVDAVAGAAREALETRGGSRLGRFLVLTGLDKAGKETQCFNPSAVNGVNPVKAYLEGRGFAVLSVNLPSYGTLLGSLVGAYLGRRDLGWPVRVEGRLHSESAWVLWSLDRAQYNGCLRRWLAESERHVALAKRWTESHLAYQTALGMGEECIVRFERNIVQPDHTLLLDVSATEALERGKSLAPDSDRYEEISFLGKVREKYLQLAAGGTRGTFQVVDASGSPQHVNSRVLSALAKLGF